MKNSFKVIWSVDDGYVGKDRPHSLDIEPSDIEDDMTDDDLERLLDDSVRDAFEREISATARNADEFLEWARGIRDSKNEENT